MLRRIVKRICAEIRIIISQEREWLKTRRYLRRRAIKFQIN